ncbi:hypothetical protein B0H14DRAFT_2653808 [Mycena olivaceomarginata]|nr:hypothetical protein B0H14DRAFT_2653808 [Mycena olivaceomarginata]
MSRRRNALQYLDTYAADDDDSELTARKSSEGLTFRYSGGIRRIRRSRLLRGAGRALGVLRTGKRFALDTMRRDPAPAAQVEHQNAPTPSRGDDSPSDAPSRAVSSTPVLADIAHVWFPARRLPCARRLRQIQGTDAALPPGLSRPNSMRGRSPSPPTSSQPPAKRQRTQDEQGEDEDDQDDEVSDQEEDEEKLLRLFRRPTKFVNHRLQQLLDLAAADDDDDTDGEDDDDNEDVEEIFWTIGEEPDNAVIRVRLVDVHEHEREHAEALRLAAHYDEAAAEFYRREDRVDEFPVVPGTWVQAAERRDLDSSGHGRNASHGGLHDHNVFLPRAQSGVKTPTQRLVIRALAEPDDNNVLPGTWVKTRQSKKTQKELLSLYRGASYTRTGCAIQAKRPAGTDASPHSKNASIPAPTPPATNCCRLSAASIRICSRSPTTGHLPPSSQGTGLLWSLGSTKASTAKASTASIAALISRRDSETHEVVQYAKVIPPGPNGVYPGPNRVYDKVERDKKKPEKNKNRMAYTPTSCNLKRSGLDLCFVFKIGDRARVVGGILYSGVTGRVERVEDGGSLVISISRDTEVVGSTTISPGLEDRKIFTISIEHVTRIWELGDFVRVTSGDHKNATGFIVSARGGWGGGHLFLVESESERLLGGIPNPGLNPGPAVGEFRWGQNPLMYTGVRYAERHFQVIVGGKHLWKGLRGEVIGDYDGPKRASKLEAWMKEWKYTKSSSAFDPRKGGEDASWKTNQDEIFVTIKEIATNKTVSGIPLKNVWHEPRVEIAFSFLKRLNKHVGEATGEWISVPELAMKRVDVQVVGIQHLHKITPSMAALEGKCGWLLLANPPPLNEPKIEVFGVGKNSMKHKIERGCIKPRRKDDAGKELWEITARVIILGPDIHHNTAQKGKYALTFPELVSIHGPGVVPVKLEGGQGPLYFPAWSLALAKNVKIQALHGVFDVTIFR